MTLYSEKVLEEFRNPENIGEIKEPDGVGKVGNPICGDVMKLFIKVDHDKIVDIKFKTFGCAAAIATSSILTKLVKGKTVEQAKKVNNKDVVNELGGLPEHKVHCSLLAVSALKKAIRDYENKKH